LCHWFKNDHIQGFKVYNFPKTLLNSQKPEFSKKINLENILLAQVEIEMSLAPNVKLLDVGKKIERTNDERVDKVAIPIYFPVK
jgi:hypothetical protein